MKANELMVGNFAWADGSNVLIREIGEKQTCVSWDDKRPEWKFLSRNLIPNDWIQPIPITEEFLERNGFVLDDDIEGITEEKFYLLKLDKFTITIHEGSNTIGRDWWIHIDNEDCCSIASADIQYVHQLQNLLNIMNIEFNIEL